MLLIAVTGPVGAGKSTLLAAIAAEEGARGRRVDGFVATAGRRVEADRGAEAYTLRWVASGYEMPFAERAEHEGASPPYRFDEAGLIRVRAWAGSLATLPPVDLVVLDEFGRAEVAGQGLAPIWPAVVAGRPYAVAIGVRHGMREEVEAVIGQPFDIVIDAAAPDALSRLREACLARDDWARVGLFGAGAGGIEVSAGSMLHASRMPMRGLALSTTQSVVLAYAGDGLGRRVRVGGVPFVAAGLKALSPAGNRLRPMLAIMMQGVLFTLATRLLGWHRAGLFAGGFLVGLWAGTQGLLMQYLLVGQDLFRGYDAFAAFAERYGLGLPGLMTLVVAWALFYGLVAGSVTAWAWRRGSVGARIERALAKAPSRLPSLAPAATWRTAAAGALRDLARPAFWLPVLILAAVLLASGSPAERAAWLGLRASAVGLVLFALARRLDPVRAGSWLRRRGRWGPAVALERALGSRDR